MTEVCFLERKHEGDRITSCRGSWRHKHSNLVRPLLLDRPLGVPEGWTMLPDSPEMVQQGWARVVSEEQTEAYGASSEGLVFLRKGEPRVEGGGQSLLPGHQIPSSLR